jgi:hypothetical protein
MSKELTTVQSNGPALFRASTDAASLCKEIVVATAKPIQGRKFVQVEGWQAIAIAHGCVASAGEVTKTEEGGFSAVGKVIRMDTGALIATAEGYVGPDEPTWFGGQANGRTLPKRPDYAIRAMAQTRAISRACRSAFAHVVVMMNAGLSTTPAEEVPPGGFDDEPVAPTTDWLTPALDAIAKAADKAALKTAYDAGIASARKYKDLAARDKIVAAKDARKAQLDAVAKQPETIDVNPETGEVI